MALDLQLRIQNNVLDDNEENAIILIDETGDYDVTSNPGGWGTPNSARAALSDSDVVVTPPDGVELASFDLGTWATTTALASKDLTADLDALDTAPQDGIWKFVFTLAGTSQTSATVYAFRDTDIKKRLIQLSQNNLDLIDFQTAKNLYDKIVYAFEAENYTLAQDLYDDLSDLLDEDSVNFIGCGC